jgi:hypothetical protein
MRTPINAAIPTNGSTSLTRVGIHNPAAIAAAIQHANVTKGQMMASLSSDLKNSQFTSANRTAAMAIGAAGHRLLEGEGGIKKGTVHVSALDTTQTNASPHPFLCAMMKLPTVALALSTAFELPGSNQDPRADFSRLTASS